MAKRSNSRKPGWLGKILMRFGAAEPPASKTPAAMKQEHKHLVDLELKQLVEADPDSAVHIVSLREYSQATGADWLMLRPKVMRLAETILNRLVAQGANIMPREDFFLVTFKRQSPARNKQQILEVCIELGQRLVGANFKVTGNGLSPSIGHAEIQAKDLQAADAFAVLTALETAVWKAQSTQKAAPPEMLAIDTPPSQEQTFVAIEAKPQGADANWEALKRERNGGMVKMVDMKTEPQRPNLVFGQSGHKKVAWN